MPQRSVGLGRVKIPDAQQVTAAREFAVLTGCFGVLHEGQTEAEVVEAQHGQCARFFCDE